MSVLKGFSAFWGGMITGHHAFSTSFAAFKDFMDSLLNRDIKEKAQTDESNKHKKCNNRKEY